MALPWGTTADGFDTQCATSLSGSSGALSQLRAATDPAAPGGGFYGPLCVTNGPPVRKPLIRPGSDQAIRALWEVDERETGVRVDVRDGAAIA
jgi:hypothetical protein